MSRCSSYVLQCDGLYFFFFFCSLAYYPLLLDFASCACVSNSVTVAFTSQHQLGAQFLPHVLQFSPGVSQCGATWASLPCIMWHLLSCVQIFSFLFSPLITPVWVSPPPPTLGVLTPVSALDLLWQLSFLHLSSFPNKVNPDSHSAMYYCRHVLSASSFFLSSPLSLLSP